MLEFSNCKLEIDKGRGVVYVHSETGQTLIRIQNIPLLKIDNFYHQSTATIKGMIDLRMSDEGAMK